MDERNAIRRSYSAIAAHWNFTYSLYFLLGDSILQNELEKESSLHGDLIIGDFQDTYDNLPLKTFMALQFFGVGLILLINLQ